MVHICTSGIERVKSNSCSLRRFQIKKQSVLGQKVPYSYVQLEEVLQEERSYRGEGMLPIIYHRDILNIVRAAHIELDEEELKQVGVT